MEGANRKIKGTIHWVDATRAVPAEIRLYDRLFSVARPDDESDGKTYRDHINPDSRTVVQGYVEPAAVQATPETRFQFERTGYFVAARSRSAERRGGKECVSTCRYRWQP